jgi:ABC-type transport system involved in multi-copper enzyme maturation permease subunit
MIRRDLLGPVLFKELATQLRGSRAALLITLYVGLVLIAARLFYGLVAAQLDYGRPLLSAQIGQVLFIGVSLVVQTLTVFLAPATTVSAISQEHERGTFALILATPLSAGQLLVGKLLAALAFMLLLLLAVAPAMSLVLLFGGVAISDVLRVLATTLITAVVGCAFGLCCSAITRQTYSATLLCYALLISLVGGSLFAANVWSLVNGLTAAPPAIVAANPLSAMATALAPVRPPDSTVTGAFRPLVLLGLLSRGTIDAISGEAAPTYRATAMIYGAATIIFFWVALQAVRPRRRFTREDGLMLIVLLGYGLIAYLLRGWWVPGIFPAA